jgi:Flp pilus assembly protein TadG
MKGHLSKLTRKEDGSTIELVMWMPIFVLILSLIADVSLIFHGQSRVYWITQVANRALSIGNLESVDAAEEYIVGAVSAIGGHATVSIEVLDGIIHTIVNVPASDFAAIGMFHSIMDINLTIASDHVQETA